MVHSAIAYTNAITIKISDQKAREKISMEAVKLLVETTNAGGKKAAVPKPFALIMQKDIVSLRRRHLHLRPT